MFRGPHLYTVHVKPGYRPGNDEPVFIREGFNWWGFLFTLLWSLYNRLWLASVLIFAFNIGVGALQHAGLITEGSGFAVLLASQVIIGFHGNDWIRDGLRKRGYFTSGVVVSDSLLNAQLRFLEQAA